MSDVPGPFWRLKGPQIWGDYGDVLFGGLFDDPMRTDERINLTRSGPFVPPIFVLESKEVIVTDAFAKLMEQEGIHSRFREVNLTKVVRIPWETWDSDKDLPKKPPPDLEPENYLLKGRHSPDTASQMERLWEVVLRNGATSETSGSYREKKLFIKSSTWNGDSIFHVNPRGTFTPIIVSDQAKAWLEQHAPIWVSFRETIAMSD